MGRDYRTLGWAAGFVLCWSSGFVGAVLAEPAGSVAGVLAWRYLITAVVVLAAAALIVAGPPTRRDVVQQAVIGLLAHAVFLAGVFGAAAGGVSAGTVALVCALQPMVVTLAGRIGWGDRVSARQVAGIGVGLLAVAASVGGELGGAAGLLVLPLASLLALSGAALLERRWRTRVDVVAGLGIQVTVSAMAFLAYAGLTRQLAIPVTSRLVGALAWLVLASGIGGYLTFLVCLRTLGSTRTSLLLYLTPAVTTLWAWLMFRQHPTGWQWLGLCLAAVGVACAWPRVSEATGVGRGGRRRRRDTCDSHRR